MIDIDILFMGEAKVDLRELTIPHVRIAERAFVLAPLEQVLSDVLPILEATAAELLVHLHQGGVRKSEQDW